MEVLVAPNEAEHQVPDVEGPILHPTAMVPVQRLLVLGRAEEGNIVRFIELVWRPRGMPWFSAHRTP